jgi:hypothetical protein
MPVPGEYGTMIVIGRPATCAVAAAGSIAVSAHVAATKQERCARSMNLIVPVPFVSIT